MCYNKYIERTETSQTRKANVMLKIFEGYVKNDETTMIRVHGYACTAGACAATYGKPDIGKYVDVTADYFVTPDENPIDNTVTRLQEDLSRCGWGSVEIGYISELLSREFAKMNR